MMSRLSLPAALIAAGITLTPAIAQDAGTVVATVNGAPITLGEMIAMKQGMADDPSAAALPDAALWDLMLDQLIRQTAMAGTAGSLTAGDVARLAIQERSYRAAAALEQVARAAPDEVAVQAAYARFFGGDGPVTEYHAAHILVETEEAAIAVREKLDAGEEFGKLAEERSTGPTGPNKGDLGWFTADQMVPPFAEAVKAMEPGTIAGPVQTQFGWHLIRLIETRVKTSPKLESVRDQIVVQLRREQVESAIAAAAAAAAVVKTPDLDPAMLGRTDLLDAPAGD